MSEQQLEQKLVTLGVTGMTCAACSNRIEKVLNKMDGVEANVNLTMEKATVKYDPSKQSVADIQSKIENLGYGIATEKVALDIEGMTCNHCKMAVTKALTELEGVSNVEVHLQEGTVDVDYDEAKVNVEKLKEAIENQGYDVK